MIYRVLHGIHGFTYVLALLSSFKAVLCPHCCGGSSHMWDLPLLLHHITYRTKEVAGTLTGPFNPTLWPFTTLLSYSSECSTNPQTKKLSPGCLVIIRPHEDLRKEPPGGKLVPASFPELLWGVSTFGNHPKLMSLDFKLLFYTENHKHDFVKGPFGEEF